MARGQQLIQKASAHAGEQNHHVEFARKQALGKLKSFLIALDGYFAHGWREDRFALLAPNQFRHFNGAPAFEGENFAAGE